MIEKGTASDSQGLLRKKTDDKSLGITEHDPAGWEERANGQTVMNPQQSWERQTCFEE